MFEKLFSYSAVLRRHRSAPLAAEREAFLEMLEAKGVSHAWALVRTDPLLPAKSRPPVKTEFGLSTQGVAWWVPLSVAMVYWPGEPCRRAFSVAQAPSSRSSPTLG